MMAGVVKQSVIDITNSKDMSATTPDRSSTVMYMDDRKRLTDAAIDRFCMASCTLAMIRKIRTFRSREKEKYLPKPIGWVRSLSLTRVMSQLPLRSNGKKRGSDMSPPDKERMRRKLGMGKRTFSSYDTVLFSMYEDEHWSLMVFYIQSDGLLCAYHYDSLVGCHADLARRVIEALVYLSMIPRECELRRLGNYPQQNSDFECGYSVLMMVGAVTSSYLVQIGREPTHKLPVKDFPSLDAKGVYKLYNLIFKTLNNKTEGEYPSEQLDKMGDISKVKSLVTLYRHTCEGLLGQTTVFETGDCSVYNAGHTVETSELNKNKDHKHKKRKTDT